MSDKTGPYRIAVASDGTRTFTVVYGDGEENLSHHESMQEARAAVARYVAADKRRAKSLIANSHHRTALRPCTHGDDPRAPVAD